MALCQEGDEVIVPAPYWTSYPEPQLAILVCTRHVKCCHEALWRLQTIQTPEAAAAAYSKCALRNWLCPNDEDIVKLSGASPVIMETLASSGYAIDATKLAATITPKTRMLIDPWRTRVDRFDAKIANFSTLFHRLWRFHTCDRSQSTDEYWVCNPQKLQDQLWGVQSIKSNRWDRSLRNILQAWTVWDDVGCIFIYFHVFSVVALRCFICGQAMPWAGCAMSKQELEAIAEVLRRPENQHVLVHSLHAIDAY